MARCDRDEAAVGEKSALKRRWSGAFYALNHVSSSDFGQTWTKKPVEYGETLGRRAELGAVIVAACDFAPRETRWNFYRVRGE